MRQGPTAPVYIRTDLGEMKMPEPIIVPTIRQMPLSRPTWTWKRQKAYFQANAFSLAQGHFLWSAKLIFPLHTVTFTVKKYSRIPFWNVGLWRFWHITCMYLFDEIMQCCHLRVHLLLFVCSVLNILIPFRVRNLNLKPLSNPNMPLKMSFFFTSNILVEHY